MKADLIYSLAVLLVLACLVGMVCLPYLWQVQRARRLARLRRAADAHRAKIRAVYAVEPDGVPNGGLHAMRELREACAEKGVRLYSDSARRAL